MTTVLKRSIKKQAKRQRILDAALNLFSQEGYDGTSMDAIAQSAEVSKPTLYMYFGSKEQLFEAIMLSGRDEMLEPFDLSTADMVGDLHKFAWNYARVVMRPQFLSLARLIISETQRFPAIGRAYQQAGPDRVLKGMINFLNQKKKNRQLVFEDAELAAQDLWALILSAPRNQALYMPENVPDQKTIARYVNNGLYIFLKAYSTNPIQDIKRLQSLAWQPRNGKGKSNDT
jgi:TetR/AcrR family transcriptional regulator, mexJK operon transcriptional repressor